MTMTSCKPYLIRAMHDWIEDNQCTPYLLVDATFPGVDVPFEYVKDGQIVLNISASATGNLSLGDKLIEFNARFGGKPRHLIVPLAAVLFIYARENGEGMPFPPEPKPQETPTFSVVEESGLNEVEKSLVDEKSPDKKNKASHLKVIK